MAMHHWRGAHIRAFVPPGKQLFIEVTFHSPSRELEVRIQENPHHGPAGGLASFQSKQKPDGAWHSPPNKTAGTWVYYVEPLMRDASRPHQNWQHFDDHRTEILYQDEQNAVYAFEDGRDADFNDARVSLHWQDV
jgi:hypothetical protein